MILQSKMMATLVIRKRPKNFEQNFILFSQRMLFLPIKKEEKLKLIKTSEYENFVNWKIQSEKPYTSQS